MSNYPDSCQATLDIYLRLSDTHILLDKGKERRMSGGIKMQKSIPVSGIIRVKTKASIANAVWDNKTNKISFAKDVNVPEDIQKACDLLNKANASADIRTNYIDIKRDNDGHITALSMQMFRTNAVSFKGESVVLDEGDRFKFKNIYAYWNARTKPEELDAEGNDPTIKDFVDEITTKGVKFEAEVNGKKKSQTFKAEITTRVSGGKIIETLTFPGHKAIFGARIYTAEGEQKVFRNIDPSGIVVEVLGPASQ